MKRFLKISGIILLVLLAIFTGLYFYVTNNAEKLIKDLVSSQSDGKFSLEIKKINFNLAKLHLSIIEPHLSSNDSINLETTYDVRLDKIVVDLAELKPLLYHRKFIIDSFACIRPQIIATKWKDKPTEKFSLNVQMAKAYTTLNDILTNLNIKYCFVEKGSLTLINKLEPDKNPITITDYNIRIDNLKADTASQDGYRFSDRTRFYSSHQDIVFPDGYHGIKYSQLRINSRSRSIEIDSCYLYGKQPGDGFKEFGVFLDTLRLSNVDFHALTLESLIKADSAICKNPVIDIHNEIAEQKKTTKKEKIYLSRDSMELAFKRLFGDINMKYIGILNAKFLMETKSKDKITTYSSLKNDLILKDVLVVKDPAIPLEFGSIYFGLNSYTTYNDDSSYSIKFDSIIFRNRKIKLANFAISPTPKNRDAANRKEIKMTALEIEQFSWLDIILNRRLVASDVYLVNPEIFIATSKKKAVGPSKPDQTVFQLFHTLSEKIEFDKLTIRDAGVNFHSSHSQLSLNKVNAVIGADVLLTSENMNEVVSSLDNISFASGKLNTGGAFITLEKGVINGRQKTLTIGDVTMINPKKSTFALLHNVEVANVFQNKPRDVSIGSIKWDKAAIRINPGLKKDKPVAKLPVAKNNEKEAMRLVLNDVDGGNTTITYSSGKETAEVIFDRIKTDKIEWESGEKPIISGLAIKGNSLKFSNAQVNLVMQQFNINDLQASSLNNISVKSVSKKDTISVNVLKLAFTPEINSLVQGNPDIKDVVINNPEISIITTGDTTSDEKTTAKKNGKLPSLTINSIRILNPVFAKLPGNISEKLKVAGLQSEWHINDIRIDSNKLSVAGLHSTVQGFSVESKNLNLAVKDEGKIEIDAGPFNYQPASEQHPSNWDAKLNSLSAANVVLITSKNDTVTQHINLHSINTGNLSFKSSEKIAVHEMLNNSPEFVLSKGNISINSATSMMKINGIEYDHFNHRFSLDSFSVKPILDRDSFMKTKVWETDYMEFKTGKTVISGIDHEMFFTDSVWHARKVELFLPRLSVYKDKRIPYDFSKIKRLPTILFQKISARIRIDTIRLYSTDITYQEFNDKTKMIGSVYFKRSQVLVENIKNFDIKPSDSLRISATSWFMDSAFLRLRFTESYVDTLDGFTYAVRVRPFNLSIMNPMLGPLVSAKIVKGRVDTIRLNAIGSDYVAHGKVKMYYKDLKAQYLNKGKSETKTLKTRIINFAANDLILRHNNTKGYGEVYAERVRERGFINYWLKMLISGAMSSTGVKSNKKQEKKYYKTIEKLNIPELPDVELD